MDPALRGTLAESAGRQADYVLDRARERFQACKLELHPSKTRIVYCKVSSVLQGINRTTTPIAVHEYGRFT